MEQSFASFSSAQAGFSGYLNLLQTNYPDAYAALTDDTKTMADFAKGLVNGKLGAYATNPNYEAELNTMFNGVLKDYKKEINSQLKASTKEIDKLQKEMKEATDTEHNIAIKRVSINLKIKMQT